MRKQELRVYLPNGEMVYWTTDKSDMSYLCAESISMLNNNIVSVSKGNCAEVIYSGLPFVLDIT